MNPILKRALIDEAAQKLARLALESREDTIYFRDQLKQQYGPEFLEAVDAEWPFIMLALIMRRGDGE